MKWENCDEKKLWQYVAGHLAAKRISSTLVGGAVAAIYSNGRYRSGDLDMVIENVSVSKNAVSDAMRELGFEKTGRHWRHSKCKHLFVEFVPPPVAIGRDIRIQPKTFRFKGLLIKMLSPEDSIKDRLASYIYFGAKECLEQAVLVAKAQKIVWKRIREWCAAEGTEAQKAYREFYRECKK